MSSTPLVKPPGLSTGSRLVILGQENEARSTIVVRVKDGLIWISGGVCPGAPGDLVNLIHVVPGDAQYWARARVELIPPETLALRRTSDWDRRQRRSHVRLSTHGVRLELQRAEDEDESEALEQTHPMIDVSAGGTSVRTSEEFDVGESVRCSFRLPEVGHFELDARVVRMGKSSKGATRRAVGFEFISISPVEQASLRRWIYAEEARRHREARERAEADAKVDPE